MLEAKIVSTPFTRPYLPLSWCKNKTFYILEINLKNNSDSTLKYWEMTCDWQMNWIFSNNSIRILGPETCVGNYPHIFTLKPYESNKGRIAIYLLEPLKNQSVRIGFVLIRKGECSGMFGFFDFQNILENKIHFKKDIIWSNELKF